MTLLADDQEIIDGDHTLMRSSTCPHDLNGRHIYSRIMSDIKSIQAIGIAWECIGSLKGGQSRVVFGGQGQ